MRRVGRFSVPRVQLDDYIEAGAPLFDNVYVLSASHDAFLDRFNYVAVSSYFDLTDEVTVPFYIWTLVDGVGMWQRS